MGIELGPAPADDAPGLKLGRVEPVLTCSGGLLEPLRLVDVSDLRSSPLAAACRKCSSVMLSNRYWFGAARS